MKRMVTRLEVTYEQALGSFLVVRRQETQRGP